MTDTEKLEEQSQEVTLEGGTYEIIRSRLINQGKELYSRLDKLNTARKEVFGAIETKLLSTSRISTENNCMPRDMIPVGNLFIFGYNVHIGLKSEVQLSDVFAVYSYENREFHAQPLEIIKDEKFEKDFKSLYRYYKNTYFAKFSLISPYLYMVFRVGKNISDIKVFKWLLEADKLIYIDNRSEYEFEFPPQHELQWIRIRRELHRTGLFPHISIEDRIFVETTGGDLTIKIEDNTDTGEGIYAEPVDNPDQTLDDAEIYYAINGNLVILKMKPYQEKDFRYIVYNEKVQQARRIDSIKDSCILLPDNHGLIFSNGYYLQTGEFKEFDHSFQNMLFDKRIQSPNGEDFLYVFYNREIGVYILLSYNLIEQKVDIPIISNGYAFFSNGEFVYFRAEKEPQKHHMVQIWQTPYVGPNYVPPVNQESYLFKIGNKDTVRAMAECNEIYNLTRREDTYSNLYYDIVKKTSDVIDFYFWIGDEAAFNLRETLTAIRDTASAALDEFEKVIRIKQGTEEQVEKVKKKTDDVLLRTRRGTFHEIDQYVRALGELRTVRGEIITLKDLRYVDKELVESMESEVEKETDKFSKACVEFLLKPKSLKVYEQKIIDNERQIGEVKKGKDAKSLEEKIDGVADELDLLIDIVSNLKIDDPTKTTQIIDSISNIYTRLNQSKAGLKKKKKEILSTEAVAEFNSQMKLINQGVINYLDVCGTPEKTEEYLTKLMVQLEELEGRFVDFDEFIIQLTEKREEIYTAFESKKLSLLEARNKRAAALQSAAERILKGIKNRVSQFITVNEINGYFAGDLMVDKIRDIVKELIELKDMVRADDIETRLKTAKEEAVRQLKDRQELFDEGENIIKLGNHRFSVTSQPLDVTVVVKDEDMFFHLTGTNFFEKITDPEFLTTKQVWDQELLSENREVYRGEYLAYQLLKASEAGNILSLEQVNDMSWDECIELVQKFMGPRYEEGYVKGVHDNDAGKIFKVIAMIKGQIGLLCYPPQVRACAFLFWNSFVDESTKARFTARIKGIGDIIRLFPKNAQWSRYIQELCDILTEFIRTTKFFADSVAFKSSEYLFHELATDDAFVISPEASNIYDSFFDHLESNKYVDKFNAALSRLDNDPTGKFELIRTWLNAFIISQNGASPLNDYVIETASLIFTDTFDKSEVLDVSSNAEILDMTDDHPVIEKGIYRLNYIKFIEKLSRYEETTVPLYQNYQSIKKSLISRFKGELCLDEFRPRVLTSFVRNRLIDKVYLPLIGDNLAKQIGVVGEQKRTDRMGLLLLISPPGYGKTTLMEYIANRLGIIFMKINGPAIGYQVTSLDPAEAPNAGAREEVEKLSLALEMGDNVMIYLDDIQHCNPEFLQKFISLCDAQRRIEGVYKGRTKTYDLRGKKICVVMAGNPYTESGEKFQIPDMLANRADTYNLGDIIGNTYDEFLLSYLENSLTSNPVLNNLAAKSQKDVYTFIRMAETGDREGLDFEANYSIEEMNEYVNVLKKLIKVRDVILKVNKEYIRSASQSDEFRTEPPFKLQGSYRNMNKIAEKVLPVMNEKEVQTLILSHYDQEAQTLTTGAEANLLKFKELTSTLTEEEAERWSKIKKVYMKNIMMRHGGSEDRITELLENIAIFGQGVDGIRQTLSDIAFFIEESIKRQSGKGPKKQM